MEDNLDWEIISTNKFEHDRKQDIKFINYHVFDNSKEKNYSVQMIEFKKENDHSIIHYIKELFILKYLSTKIDNRNIIFVKTCLYFEKVDRFHREIKRNLLITTECSLLILKESVLLRKMRQNPWTNQELLSIFKSLLFLFSELEKLGFSHNCLNLNNIFYSKSEEIYKVGNFVCSWHKSQGEFETEELEHMKTNRKYNSPTINEFIDKTLTKDYPKTMNVLFFFYHLYICLIFKKIFALNYLIIIYFLYFILFIFFNLRLIYIKMTYLLWV